MKLIFSQLIAYYLESIDIVLFCIGRVGRYWSCLMELAWMCMRWMLLLLRLILFFETQLCFRFRILCLIS